MEILFEHPRASSVWKLVKETDSSGRSRILSGYGGKGHFYRWEESPGSTYEEIPNVVFWAKIRATGQSRGRSSAIIYFSDADGIHKYQTGIAGAMAIIRATQNGVLIKSDDHYLEGVFSFQKQGKEVYLFPVEDEDLLERCLKERSLA